VAVKYLLDTNAYAGLMRGSDAVVSRVRRAERILLSSVVVGELLYGFRNGTRYEANRAQLDVFLANRFVVFLPVTLTTAERFGLIAAALKRKGAPIPSNDIWIAAHALETGADLMSFDGHFSHVDGLAFVHLRERGQDPE
jgi:tRNA(fMet)-specific endonuclease VapC